jgi:RNA polymerase sigma-70 factor (ECF subfamily)
MDKERTVASIWGDAAEAEAGTPARAAADQITEWYLEHADALHRSLACLCRSEEDARDVVQEAFLRLYEVLLAGEEEIRNPGAWLYAVAKRRILNGVRRSRIHATQQELMRYVVGVLAGTSPNAEEALIARQRERAVAEAIEALPEIQQQCLRARARGHTYRDISRIFGLDFRRASEAVAKAVRTLRARANANEE